MSASARSVVDRDGGRKADLAAIHMAKASLGWSDEEYRDILQTVCSVRSSALLDFAGRKRFLAHLRACGYVNAKRGARSVSEWSPKQRLVWSLWQKLADAGRVNERNRAALDAWLQHHVGPQRLEWLNGPQQDQAIAMLKQWMVRQ